MRLAVSFPHALPDHAVKHIRELLAEAASAEEWRPLVVAEGGFVYDLDAPMTIVMEGERFIIEQEPVPA